MEGISSAIVRRDVIAGLISLGPVTDFGRGIALAAFIQENLLHRITTFFLLSEAEQAVRLLARNPILYTVLSDYRSSFNDSPSTNTPLEDVIFTF